MIARPHSDEYNPFYAGYIGRVPEGGDIFALMSAQPDELRALLQHVSDEQANLRPAPDEWSIKEVIGHINDAERVFAFRTMSITRGEQKALPGFEQNDYVRATDFNARSLADLVEEFALQRRANVICFQPLSEAEIDRRGTASTYPISARALLYIMVGHVMHHVESLKTSYHVS
ncbi:MAG TPA: DinB family protein [Phototrophicaceae bacterium]|nr:DinB family protein [Phototrophicaceae bacterium]